MPQWAADKCAALADPDFRRLYRAWEQAYDWDPDDPRLVELAAEAAAWLAKTPPSPPPPQRHAGISTINTLLSAQVGAASPAWRRLSELSAAQLKSSRQSESTKPHRRQA